jgi:chemotaxis signal transduction protein
MAIYSPLRSRRLAAQQAEATQRLITFKLREETFALPLDRVQKVTTLDRLYGDANGTGVSLTTYQDRELVTIDVGVRIFGQTSPRLGAIASQTAQSVDEGLQVRYLVILQTGDEGLIGLPIDSPPSIQSIARSAFRPIPDLYRQHSNIHCVSSLSIDRPDRPSIFLLDVALLTLTSNL